MGRRAVVAGGAGFLGSHICERLLADGYEVLCLDDFSTGRPQNIGHLLGGSRFTLLEADVSEPFEIPGAVDAVLHFASPASPVDYLRLPLNTLRSGSLGTFNTLDLAREKGARYLLASTSEVYGDPAVHPQHEGYWGNVNPVGPRSVYDEAKRFSEAAVMAYRRSFGLSTAIVRIFNTYGPRMRTHDGRAIPTFIRQTLDGEPITVSGTGTQTRSLCYVSDLVEGISRLLASDVAGPVNIGNPGEMTVLEIAELVRQIAGSQTPITFVSRPEDDPERRRPDISLAARLLDWSPEVSVADGLKQTLSWFGEQRQTDGGAKTS
ncbi:SDR family oxidoreductase [Streptomyces sp. NBC_01275]|uniref:UDP-glucuronic acid decarboxylase family protein n=1 Tax=Streptomyces sp. NBC_01275 TaxID=2903807 RepID=UPI00225B0051|nr:UDP-glucuronic acid decarboxylase family protein [Streptomyces sp. NBC_01275]MCX4763820.1 SDR family oxidoreductase [Streptomyces sp. NBC_01275]